MMMSGEMWTQLGSAVASLMFAWAMLKQYFPDELRHIEKYGQKLVSFVFPYVQITFNEYSGDGFHRCKAYTAIETYLMANSSSRAKRLRADMERENQSVVLSMDDREEVTDEFQGIKVRWASNKSTPRIQSISIYPNEDEKRYYKLTFHRQHRDIIIKTYLNHVLDEGKALQVKKRQRKLYTNTGSEGWNRYTYRRTMWSHVDFQHPATFETLALEPKLKQEIINDLITFSKAKEYYAKVGKAWKRGYLLYGPPGTGKSTMIAAMANLLQYDVYDLELTAVKDNTELRKLLIDTSSKSIIMIEDIDCSLDLTGQRKKEKEKDEDKEKDPLLKNAKNEDDSKSSKVTLSGLLNFIDGLCFEAFKVLAKNYLDLESHHLFTTIRCLLEETNMTPADVAENLMPKSAEDGPESCLENLIKAFEKAKEEARLKAEEEERVKKEEERLKAEEEEKQKAEKEKEKCDEEVKEKKTSDEEGK
ncbi:hypothetical protein F0562_004715 [Nyssa sinensis]|uniref:AAA+ ATPase domain-containing protein n=1 Tax=Nyssa sinensis TaxID=561372 RepID=A0A5J5BZE0_9ASTE|nr:hypothetical protein F0562_004715 [Nyssa sinensis]